MQRCYLRMPSRSMTALVAREVAPLEVVEQSPTLAYELQQPATGMVILRMDLEVLRQVHDPIGQERNLHLGRTRVGGRRWYVCTISCWRSVTTAIPSVSSFSRVIACV